MAVGTGTWLLHYVEILEIVDIFLEQRGGSELLEHRWAHARDRAQGDTGDAHCVHAARQQPSGYGYRLRSGLPRRGQDIVDAQAGHTVEMPEVAGDEVEAVMEGRRRDLQVGIGEPLTRSLELSPDPAVDLGRTGVVWQHSYRWEQMREATRGPLAGPWLENAA